MIFEALYIGKPALLFTPDLASYQLKSRDFYVNPQEQLNLSVAKNQAELEENILLLTERSHLLKGTPARYLAYDRDENLLEKLLNHES